MAEAAPRRRQGLTPPASRFIGRAADLAALRALFEQGARLVTLWGPAGMGKTRLSLQAALGWAEARPEESVWFAELAEARDLEALCSAVARTLEADLSAARGGAGLVEQIGRFLAAQGPALLVVDNLEQVVEEAAPALDRWIRMAPELRLLATSRERCRLAGEVGYELSPLSLPGGAEAAPEARSEAVELFLDRVRGKRPGLSLGDESVTAIGTLVCRLEGIPLAIELAAARFDVLGLEGLLSRLENRLGLLAGGRRGVDARQATLRSAIEWSWDLLDEAERRALARCSVFRGGFSLEAADVVLEEPDGLGLDRVEALRDKSLLKADARSASGALRFSLYEGVREFAAEKLAERGEREQARARHAAFYLGAGEADAERFARTGALDALHRVAGDLENLLAVVDHALDGPAPGREEAERALRALLVLDPVLTARGPFDAQLLLLDRALAAASPAGVDPLLEARGLAARGRARQLSGREQEGLVDLLKARERASSLASVESGEALAGILTDLGVLHHARRDLGEARTHYEEALALHRRRGDRRAEGRVLGNLGALHHDERSFDEAMRYYERALAITAAIGDRRSEGIFSTNAGLIDQEQGALLKARRRYERAAALLGEVGDRRLLSITIGNLGVLQHEEGRLGEALLSHERASALLREVGDRRSEALAESRRGAVLASLDRFEEAQAALLRADQLLARLGDELGSELCALVGAFLDLAQGRLALVEKRAAPAAELLGSARSKLAHARAGSPSLADRSDDIRLIARILERNLSPLSEEAGAGKGAEELLLAPEARWCRAPGGGWQDLRERHAVRRLLLALALHQREAPGRGLSLGALQEAGWPGERILPEAASNRIYVAFNQLRKLGLKAWLKKNAEGYFLDPGLPVHHVAFEPAEPG